MASSSFSSFPTSNKDKKTGAASGSQTQTTIANNGKAQDLRETEEVAKKAKNIIKRLHA
jgi:hypothetical protein